MDTHGCDSPAQHTLDFQGINSPKSLLLPQTPTYLHQSQLSLYALVQIIHVLVFDILLGMFACSFFAMDLAMSFYCQGTFCHIFITISVVIFRESITLQFTEIFLNACHKENCKFLHLKDGRNLTNFWNNLLDLCHLVLLNQSADDRCIPLPNADWAHDTEVFHLRLPTSQHLQN